MKQLGRSKRGGLKMIQENDEKGDQERWPNCRQRDSVSEDGEWFGINIELFKQHCCAI